MKCAKLSILFLLTICLISICDVAVPGLTPGASSGLRQAGTRSLVLQDSLIERQRAGRVPFEKFKTLRSDDEKRRLEYFANELQRDSSRSGYIIVYGRRGAPAGEAKKRAENAKNYLLTRLPAKYEKLVVTIDNCTPRPAVEYELWIVPQGNDPPKCSKSR